MRKFISLLIFSSIAFANYFNLVPIKITQDISCVIGDLGGQTKDNNGFISNVCYVNMGG